MKRRFEMVSDAYSRGYDSNDWDENPFDVDTDQYEDWNEGRRACMIHFYSGR